MKALVTGASSGIGRDIARVLAARGCDLVLTARREERLRALASELSMVRVTILPADLSSQEGCQALYRAAQGENIDILVNNAGLGLFGPFDETDLEAELGMLDVNIIAVHMLMKLFLPDLEAKGRGYILNVASSAAFLPGPQPIQQAPHSNSFAAEETALAAAIGAALAIVLEPEPTKTPALPTDGREQSAAFHSNWTAVSIQEQTRPFLPHPERRSS